MSPSIGFSRAELRLTIVDVRKHAPDINPKEAWVYCLDDRRQGHWEFHFGRPNGMNNDSPFYWHGSADNAYEARSKGWCAWLEKQGADGYGQKETE